MYGFTEVTPNELEQWQAEGRQFRLVDVRSPGETARGIIPGAELVPLHLLPLRKDEFADPETELVLYCQTGARSAQACAFLSQQGVDTANNLRGGIVGWAQAGKPIASPD